MALFKIAKGQAENMPVAKTEGYCYVANKADQAQTDHYYFYVDVSNTVRAQLAASYAEQYPVLIQTWEVAGE